MESLQSLLPFLLMFVVIYFFMIRPKQKRAKQEKEFESALKVGDKIITKSGIHGKIAERSIFNFPAIVSITIVVSAKSAIFP